MALSPFQVKIGGYVLGETLGSGTFGKVKSKFATKKRYMFSQVFSSRLLLVVYIAPYINVGILLSSAVDTNVCLYQSVGFIVFQFCASFNDRLLANSYTF